MSYCRFSCDNWKSDVYCYAHCDGGFVIDVAARRRLVSTDADLLVPIGLPYDGEEFMTDTAGECADRLESLRALGYHVPQYAIDALRAEPAAEPNSEGA